MRSQHALQSTSNEIPASWSHESGVHPTACKAEENVGKLSALLFIVTGKRYMDNRAPMPVHPCPRNCGRNTMDQARIERCRYDIVTPKGQFATIGHRDLIWNILAGQFSQCLCTSNPVCCQPPLSAIIIASMELNTNGSESAGQ